MSNNKYNTWIYRGLDLGLAVNGADAIDVTIKDGESGEDSQLTFNRKTDAWSEISKRIGDEVLSWVLLMIDQIDDEEFDN